MFTKLKRWIRFAFICLMLVLICSALTITIYYSLKLTWQYFFIEAYDVYVSGQKWSTEFIVPMFKGCFFLFISFVLPTLFSCGRGENYAKRFIEHQKYEAYIRSKRVNSVLNECLGK